MRIGRLYMRFDLSKSLWSKREDTYIFHIGYFERGEQRAYKIVIVHLMIRIGVIEK